MARIGAFVTKNSILIFVGLTLIGCSASPKQIYRSLDLASSEIVASSFQDVVRVPKITKISPGEVIEFSLAEGDPIIELTNGHRYRSYYRLLEFRGGSNQVVSFKVASLCHCSAIFRETIVYPLAFILDANGEVLSSSPVDWNRTHNFFLSGLTIEGLWRHVPTKDDRHFLLVAADNSYVGLILGIDYPLIIPESLTTYIRSSPSGRIRVEMID